MSLTDFRNASRAAYLRIHSVYCPALDATILSRREGYFHLIAHGSRRTIADQVRRLHGIPYLAAILSSGAVQIEYREETSKKHRIRYWSFVSTNPAYCYKVVIRQIGSGAKAFLSVFPI